VRTTPPAGQPFEARFRRYECKYLVTEDGAAEARHYIRSYVEPDPYAMRSPDRSYDVTSLYLDAPDFRLFWESREGLMSRWTAEPAAWVKYRWEAYVGVCNPGVRVTFDRLSQPQSTPRYGKIGRGKAERQPLH